MKKLTGRVLSAVMAAFIAVSGMSAFAVSAEENEVTTENNSKAEVSNFAETVTEYNKQHIGDVVTFYNGMRFVIWSRKIMQSEDDPNDFYVHTEYVEYNPMQHIDFTCEYVTDAIPLASNGITPYFSASNSHTYSNDRTVTATVLARFMYDGINAPSVYAAEYRISDTNCLTNPYLTSKTSDLWRTCTETLNYTYNSMFSQKDCSISVKCKKDGTQA